MRLTPFAKPYCFGRVDFTIPRPRYIIRLAMALLLMLHHASVATVAFGHDLTITTVGAAWALRETELKRLSFQVEWNETKTRHDNQGQNDAERRDLVPREESKGPPQEISSESVLISSAGRMYLKSTGLARKSSTGQFEPMTTTTVWQGKQGKSLQDYGSVEDNYGRISADPSRLVDLSLRAPFLAMWPIDTAYGHIDLDRYQVVAGRPVINGVPCYVLNRTDGSAIETEIYVDPAKGFLIQRVVGRANNDVERQMDIEYRQVDGIGWIPSGWQLIIPKIGTGEMAFQLDAIVRNVELLTNIDRSLFDIDFPPGTKVRELVGKDSLKYVALDDGKLRPYVPPETMPSSTTTAIRRMLLAGNIIGILALVFFLVRRKRNKAAASQQNQE